ncbi:hypothetical protein IW261DRAFT_1341484, partial [Armillaria novae-zelandiae]
RCFLHIVNLTCQAVEMAIDQISYPSALNMGALGNIDQNPIANLRTLIRSVSEIQLGPLQLPCDVDIRWSSTDIMIEHAILLCRANELFLQSQEQRELHKYKPSDDEWTVLKLFHEILKVPHAFQHRLSAEKTLTLCDALPAFSAFLLHWCSLQQTMPEMEEVIEAGLDKLEDYFGKVMNIPAYIFSMSKLV